MLRHLIAAAVTVVAARADLIVDLDDVDATYASLADRAQE